MTAVQKALKAIQDARKKYEDATKSHEAAENAFNQTRNAQRKVLSKLRIKVGCRTINVMDDGGIYAEGMGRVNEADAIRAARWILKVYGVKA